MISAIFLLSDSFCNIRRVSFHFLFAHFVFIVFLFPFAIARSVAVSLSFLLSLPLCRSASITFSSFSHSYCLRASTFLRTQKAVAVPRAISIHSDAIWNNTFAP